MINLLVIAFILLMVYWWSEQGLFSAVIHLLLTLVAAVIALAMWEPLAYGLLLNLIPEHAWAVALLMPFAVSLLLMKYVVDRYVPGNLEFPHLVNRFGGAVVGSASGVLTAGILVIGLQMSGLPGLFGYEPLDLDPRAEDGVTREQTLWIPADEIAGQVLYQISNGAMAPALSGATASQYYRSFDIEAGLYNHPSFPHSRRAMAPDRLRLIDDEPMYIANELPPTLAQREDLTLGSNERIVILPSEISLDADDGPATADGDGNFRASPHQVALGYRRDDGRHEITHPLGLIQRGEFAPLTVAGMYATGMGDRVRYHWIFRIPDDAEPQFLRIKNVRVDVPDQRVDEIAAIEGLITYERTEVAAAENGDSSSSSGARTQPQNDDAVAVVSNALPTRVHRRIMGQRGADLSDDNVLLRGSGTITDTGRPQRDSAVSRMHHPDNARLVQVRLGERRQARSFLGQIMQQATATTTAPVLVDQHDNTYRPIGYFAVAENGRRFRFSFDPNERIRSLADLELGRVADEESLTLIFQVEAGVTITRLEMSHEIIDLNLEVPRN